MPKPLIFKLQNLGMANAVSALHRLSRRSFNLSKEIVMKIYSSIAIGAVLLGLGGCAGMTHTERDTAIGAGVGAAAGGLLTGSPVGVVGGAVVGGVVGHEVGERHEDRRYR